MSYDRIRVEQSGQLKQFLERRQAEKMGRREEFKAQYDRLYRQGHFVILSAGKNFAFDELFLFEEASNATAFYESGFSEWESFIGGEVEGCGFQEVSLYRAGTRSASKSSAPSPRTEKEGTEDLWAEWANDAPR
jgi:hypothetical protein